MLAFVEAAALVALLTSCGMPAIQLPAPDTAAEATASPTFAPSDTPTAERAAAPLPSATPTQESSLTPSATPTDRPTATPEPTATQAAPTLSAPSATPELLGEILIEGLDEPALFCGQLVFYRGDEELARVDLRGHADGRVTYPWGTADRLVFLGSPDGQCPWSQFTLRDLNPDRIAIADRVLRLRFDRIVRTPRPTEPAGST